MNFFESLRRDRITQFSMAQACRASKPIRRAIVSAAFPVLLLSGLFSQLSGQEPRKPEPTGPAEIHALARLEPRSGLLTVGARPGARVIRLLVEEGDDVKEGATLAVLEGSDQAAEQLAIAKLQKENATSKRSRAKRKFGLEREHSDKLFEARKQSLERQDKLNSEKNNKLQTLYKGMTALGALAKLPAKDQFEFEAALYLVEIQSIKSGLDLSELKIGRASLDQQRMLEDEELAENGPEDQMLDHQFQLAKATLDQTIVRAPAAGKVLSIVTRAGEISSGGVLILGDPTSIVAQAEVDQSDIGRLKEGDRSSVTILGQTVTGKVSRIGRLVGFNQMRNVDPRAIQDLRVVRVTVELSSTEFASRYLGMQVDVAIKPASVASIPSEARPRP